jgi:hypothetical protein
MASQATEHVNVIEVRKAKNGYVVSAWMNNPYNRDNCMPRGYATYVVQSDDPLEVGKAVEQAIRDHAITLDVVIPPARELP